MYQPRIISSHVEWLDDDGIKIYTISVNNHIVNHEQYLPRLNEIKSARNIDWRNTPAFTIFHEGETYKYLVLVWWGNDNELFTSVSVLVGEEWIEDASKYSFCLYDLEVMWSERHIFIETIDCETPSLHTYRRTR